MKMTLLHRGPAAALAAFVLSAAPAWGYGGGYHYGAGMMYGGWGGGIFGWLMMFLVFVLVVAVVIGALRWVFGSGRRTSAAPRSAGKTALEILEERFARGEIDKAEFEEKRRLLSDSK